MIDQAPADLLTLRRETANDAPTAAQTARHRHIPALDGLRGLAILLVFLVHYGGGAKSTNPVVHAVGVAITAGWCGVTLFFILSGFLISGILWDSRHQPRWWRNFYMRRTLRIFPLYYASLAVVVLAALAVGHGAFALSHLYVYALYLQNLPLPLNAGNLRSPLDLSHFWSLAVEEQFYLLWPFLLPRMKDLARARWLCAAAFLLSAGFRLYAWYLLPAHDPTGVALHRAFFGAFGFTFSRAGELAAGAWLAMAYRDAVLWARVKRWAPALLFAGLLGFLLVGRQAHTFSEESVWGFLLGIPLITVALSALLVRALGDGVANRVAVWPVLRWFGGISYGFYVFHVLFTPVYNAIAAHLVSPEHKSVYLGLNFLVAGSLSTALAWFSFRFFESRFLRRRARYLAG